MKKPSYLSKLRQRLWRNAHLKSLWYYPEKIYKYGISWWLADLRLAPQKRREIINLIDEEKPQTALEIGAGRSPVIINVPKQTYIDISQTLLDKIEKKREVHNVEIRKADISLKIPLKKEEHYDVITINEVLSHIKPKKRPGIIKNLSEHTNKLVIFEAAQLTLNEEISPFKVKGGVVDINELAKVLKKQGFSTKIEEKTNNLNAIINKILIAKKKVSRCTGFTG